MLEVKIYDLKNIENVELTRVVCVCHYKDKWVFSFNKKRNGWEIPGGHIEKNETWEEAITRELYEETGATKVKIMPICLYKISTYGLLCFAHILELENLPDSEISHIGLFDDIPDNLTYKDTHTLFFNKVRYEGMNKNE